MSLNSLGSLFPTSQTLSLNGNLLSLIPGGSSVNLTGTGGSSSDWSQYPAVQSVDFNSQNLANVLTINGNLYPQNDPTKVPFIGATQNLNLGAFNLSANQCTVSDCIVQGASVAQAISGTTTNVFYVAKNGNDTNPGSLLRPKLTIQNAITSAEALNPTATSQIVIEVAPGQYTENLTFTKGYTTVKSYSAFSDMNEVVELTGTISVNITGVAPDLFNRQVILQGFAITGSITDTSTVQHSLAVVSCRIFGNARLIYQNSSVDNRTYLEDITISQDTALANTDPMIQIASGTARCESITATAKNSCSVIAITGTGILGTCFNCQFESTTALTPAPPPVMLISSTSVNAHNIGVCSFAYTSVTNKTASATSCGILFNTTANANMTLQFCSFFLLGTADPFNFCVGTLGGAGVKTLFIGDVLSFPSTCSQIQAGIVKVPYNNVSPNPSQYVPYTGATQNVNLGAFDLSCSDVNCDGALINTLAVKNTLLIGSATKPNYGVRLMTTTFPSGNQMVPLFEFDQNIFSSGTYMVYCNSGENNQGTALLSFSTGAIPVLTLIAGSITGGFFQTFVQNANQTLFYNYSGHVNSGNGFALLQKIVVDS